MKTLERETIKELRQVKQAWELTRERIEKFAEKLENTLIYTDAKVHDVSYYTWKEWKSDFPIFTEEEVNQEFDLFCEDNWNWFSEEFLSGGVDTEQLGRTSTFRIVGSYLSELKTSLNYNDYLGQLMDMAEGCVFTNFKEFFDNNKNHYELDELLEVYIDEMDTMNDEMEYMLDGMEEEFKEARKAYQALENFKKNQVEIFKGQLELSLDMIYELEPERSPSVVIINSEKECSNLYYTNSIQIEKSLLKRFFEEKEIVFILDNKNVDLEYDISTKLIEWARSKDRKEFFRYERIERLHK